MPGEVGPYQAQWNLRPRIDAMRAEAKSLHKDVAATFTERTTEIGIARDRAARDQYAAEQAAKSADIQVGVERKAAAANDKEIAALEQRIAEVERRGDRASANELREDAGKWAADRDAHVARARQAELDAAQLRDDGASHQRRVTELNVERADVVKQSTAAEKEVDRIDEQVQLLEQARLKYGEADMSTDVGKRAALELEAEALVTKAGAIEVDRSLIRTVVPELPETTPGIDDDAGPLPPGSGDGSSNGSTKDTDLIDPNDPDAASTTGADDTGLIDPSEPDGANPDGPDDLSLVGAGSSANDAADGGFEVGDEFGSSPMEADEFAPALAELESINEYASGGDDSLDGSGGYESPVFAETHSDPVVATDEYGGGGDDFAAPAETETEDAESSYEPDPFGG